MVMAAPIHNKFHTLSSFSFSFSINISMLESRKNPTTATTGENTVRNKWREVRILVVTSNVLSPTVLLRRRSNVIWRATSPRSSTKAAITIPSLSLRDDHPPTPSRTPSTTPPPCLKLSSWIPSQLPRIPPLLSVRRISSRAPPWVIPGTMMRTSPRPRDGKCQSENWSRNFDDQV